MPLLSIVVPVWNDAPALDRLLREFALSPASRQLEILVVDGGSEDAPATVIPASVQLLDNKLASRGAQLARGVGAARGEWLWLLHADSSDVGDALEFLLQLPSDSSHWGRFNIRLKAQNSRIERQLRWVAAAMNWRSRVTGIATGDQGIFVHRALLARIGGIPDQPLMEDIELCRRLKRLCLPHCSAITITASGRRWQEHGVIRTILRMWWFRLRYWSGVASPRLAAEYYGH